MLPFYVSRESWEKFWNLLGFLVIVFAIVVNVLMALYRLTILAVSTTITLAVFPILPNPLVTLRVVSASTSIVLLIFWSYVFHYEQIHQTVALARAYIRR